MPAPFNPTFNPIGLQVHGAPRALPALSQLPAASAVSHFRLRSFYVDYKVRLQ